MKTTHASVAAALLAGLVLGATATAATGWRVFATATDKGEYVTFASASASVQNPNALAVRAKGTSGPFEVSWFASCEGVTRPAPGVAVPIGVSQSAKCSVNATATGSKGGTVRIELLRR